MHTITEAASRDQNQVLQFRPKWLSEGRPTLLHGKQQQQQLHNTPWLQQPNNAPIQGVEGVSRQRVDISV